MGPGSVLIEAFLRLRVRKIKIEAKGNHEFMDFSKVSLKAFSKFEARLSTLCSRILTTVVLKMALCFEHLEFTSFLSQN